jgi:nuclear pore complex protein Nup155
MLTTTDGRELSRELVIATIGKYGASNSHTSFDVVSHELQRRCNSYFGPNDILFFEVMTRDPKEVTIILSFILIGYGIS